MQPASTLVRKCTSAGVCLTFAVTQNGANRVHEVCEMVEERGAWAGVQVTMSIEGV